MGDARDDFVRREWWPLAFLDLLNDLEQGVWHQLHEKLKLLQMKAIGPSKRLAEFSLGVSNLVLDFLPKKGHNVPVL
jgi:hypothetical protein